MAVWEGSGNVIALDVLRAMTREPDSVAAFDHEINLARGNNPVLDQHLDRVRRQLGELATMAPADAQLRARTVVEAMALALQASLMVRHSPAASSDAFIAARLGADRGHEYGTLPVGTDFAGILARA
jgi:putative acyl-CoA dehydrogenase